MENEKELVPQDQIGKHETIGYARIVSDYDTGYWVHTKLPLKRPLVANLIPKNFVLMVLSLLDDIKALQTSEDYKLPDYLDLELFSSSRQYEGDCVNWQTATNHSDQNKVGDIKLSKLLDVSKCIGVSTGGRWRGETQSFIMEVDLTTEVKVNEDTSLPPGKNRYLAIRFDFGHFLITSHDADDYEWCDIKKSLLTKINVSDQFLWNVLARILGTGPDYQFIPGPKKTSIIDIKSLIHEVNVALAKDTFAEVAKSLPLDNVYKFLKEVTGRDGDWEVEQLWLNRGLASVTYPYGDDAMVYKPST